jgi:hypothetical protein
LEIVVLVTYFGITFDRSVVLFFRFRQRLIGETKGVNSVNRELPETMQFPDFIDWHFENTVMMMMMMMMMLSFTLTPRKAICRLQQL